MGLQGQVSDCSSESILILAVVTIASCINYLRTLIFSLPRLSRVDPVHDEIFGRVGSGLVLLTEQLNLNRTCSTRFEGQPGSKCVVCLSGLKEGEQVRRLACCHVFHKECFCGWLQGMNFSCPLCRAPVAEESRVDGTRRRVERDIVNFFSLW